MPRNPHEDGLDVVKAIFTTTKDVQAKVDLGGSSTLQQGQAEEDASDTTNDINLPTAGAVILIVRMEMSAFALATHGPGYVERRRDFFANTQELHDSDD
jgi:hypothetical protein